MAEFDSPKFKKSLKTQENGEKVPFSEFGRNFAYICNFFCTLEKRKKNTFMEIKVYNILKMQKYIQLCDFSFFFMSFSTVVELFLSTTIQLYIRPKSSWYIIGSPCLSNVFKSCD
uniref:Uncharacterized protein n=1 Tax=Cacopsylla melanoneura TaxID=428564 RepID=A0A8D8RSB8_9HEMI